MAFGGFGSGAGRQPLAEINMIPLIDVMLVLLVIFIVTAPLLTRSRSASPCQQRTGGDQTENIQLAIGLKAAFWNGQAVSETDWRARMSGAAARASRNRNCNCAPTAGLRTSRTSCPTPRAPASRASAS